MEGLGAGAPSSDGRAIDAAGKAVSTGTGWLPDRSVGGWIAGLPDEVNAQVRIQRLPPPPHELHDVGPPLPTGTSSYDPPELTCLHEIDHLEPEETVAVVKMSNGRWGLSGLGASPRKLACNSPPAGEATPQQNGVVGMNKASVSPAGTGRGSAGAGFPGQAI